MSPLIDTFLTAEEQALVAGLDTPDKIQGFINTLKYTAQGNRSPVNVIRQRKAHCLDGGLLGAALLQRIGYPPVIVDITPVPGLDDDHVLAIYTRYGRIGCVAKSNFVGLGFREAIYRNTRELALSYFEDYYNIDGQKTLRGYTRPVNLARFDRLNWLVEDTAVDAIERYLPTLKSTPLFSEETAASLSPKEQRAYDAGMLRADTAEMYKPGIGH